MGLGKVVPAKPMGEPMPCLGHPFGCVRGAYWVKLRPREDGGPNVPSRTRVLQTDTLSRGRLVHRIQV